MPVWNDNEFIRPDGFRPVIRKLTPHRFDPVARTLDVEVVVHSGGPWLWPTVTSIVLVC